MFRQKCVYQIPAYFLLIPSGLLAASQPRYVGQLRCAPTTLASGATTQCTVTLSRRAPAGGSVVSLSSNSAMLTVPTSVTIASYTTTGTFAAVAGPVSANQTAILTAALNGSSQTADIALLGTVSPVSVSLSPSSTSLSAGQTKQFTATVTGGSGNTSVTWSLTPSAGSISSTGLYTAPANIAAQQTITVTAISVADATMSATATITLTPVGAVSVSMTPSTAALNDSQTQQFTAAVSGTSNTAVTWSISPFVGSIASSGLYTAPATIGATQEITVTAASTADTTKTATAVITLKPLVALTWTASVSTGVSGYNVYRSGVSGGPYAKINSSLVTALAYDDINVSKGNFYYYVLTSVNSSGQESAYSLEVQELVQ